MATLDNDDFSEIKRITKNDANMWNVLKSWGLSKSTWQSALQAVENWFVEAFNVLAPNTTIKEEIETVTGTCTNAQANQLVRSWIRWRDK